MQAYERSMQHGDTHLVLRPDSDFFRYFGDPSGKPPPGGTEAATAQTAPIEREEVRIGRIGIGENAVAHGVTLPTDLLGLVSGVSQQDGHVAIGLGLDLLALLAALGAELGRLTLTLRLHALVDGLAVLFPAGRRGGCAHRSIRRPRNSYKTAARAGGPLRVNTVGEGNGHKFATNRIPPFMHSRYRARS
jgi:hypothetical protein